MRTVKKPKKISDLITLEGEASSWRSVNTGGTMFIYHYSTLMAEVRDGKFYLVSDGWGSSSDKQGVSKLRRGALMAGVELVYNG